MLFLIPSLQSASKATTSNADDRDLNKQEVSTNENKGMQYYVVNPNLSDKYDIDEKAFHRHCIHPSREQLSFEELGKIYTNISRRKILSKVILPHYKV